MTTPFPQAVAESPGAERGGERATYSVLCQKHDEYDGELIEKIDDLYKGGFAIAKKARKYLCRLDGESDERFKERAEIFSYIPFLSQIVDQFTSDVFSQPLSIKPAADADNPNTPGENPDKEFYSEFEKDADKKGTSFVDLMTETLRTGLKHQRALVMVDAPKREGPAPATRADEDALGLRRYYAYACPLARMIDWEIDEDTGRLVWAKLYDKEKKKTGPLGRRDLCVETFTIWSMSESGEAQWERYEITYDVKDPPKPDATVPRVDGGSSSFKRIPILIFDLSEGLWVGNKVGPQALEHWQRRSALGGAENRSMVAIAYVKHGPQAPAVGGAIPSEVSQDPSRGTNPVRRSNSKGWLLLDSQDEVGFAEPEGKCYAIIDQQLEKLREMMFQVVFQMAASVQRNNTSMGRSGTSKKKDEDLTGRVLRALGRFVRNFGVQVFEAISEARGDDVHWTPHGLDGYDSEDREVVLEEILNLQQIVEAIPSETFHKVEARACVERLLRGQIDVETLAQILEELEDGIEEQREAKKLLKEALDEEQLARSKASKDAAENGELGGAVINKPSIPNKPGAAVKKPGAAGKKPAGDDGKKDKPS